jgi:hypothetical protein
MIIEETFLGFILLMKYLMLSCLSMIFEDGLKVIDDNLLYFKI